jgi:hypothetical protein
VSIPAGITCPLASLNDIAAMKAVMSTEEKVGDNPYAEIKDGHYWVGTIDSESILHKDEAATAAYRTRKKTK